MVAGNGLNVRWQNEIAGLKYIRWGRERGSGTAASLKLAGHKGGYVGLYSGGLTREAAPDLT